MTSRAFCALLTIPLVTIIGLGCSDDGLPGQGLLSSTSGGDDSGGLTGQDGEGANGETGNDNPDTGGDPGGDSGGGSDGATGPAGTGDATGGVESEGSGDSTGDATGMGDSTGTGDATGGSSGDTGTTGGMCMPPTDDTSAIGMDCEDASDCPAGYTCQPSNGATFQQTCQILCEQDCECPEGLTCEEFVDKQGMWMQCTP